MKFTLTIVLNAILIISSYAKQQCFIKIGFSDCINCYYALQLIKDIEKIYVIKEEFGDYKKEIFKERIGIDTNGLNIIASDSLYDLLGGSNFSSVVLMENNQIVFKNKLISFPEKHSYFRKLIDNNLILKKELIIDLGKNFHSQCFVRVLGNNQIAIQDNLKNKLLKMDENGSIIFQLDIDKLTDEIYKKNFTDYQEKLDEIRLLFKNDNNIKSITNIGNLDVFNNDLYATVSSTTISYSNGDTIIAGFTTIIKIDSDNNVLLFPINTEITKDIYYAHDAYFRIIDDTSFQISLICASIILKQHLFATYNLNKNKCSFSSLSEDTIPDVLTKNRNFNYRITPFVALDGLTAFQIQSRIFYKNKEVFKLNNHCCPIKK